MRSSERVKKILLPLAVLAVLIVFLDLALYPCTYARNDVHTVSSQQRDVLIMGTSCGKMGIDPDSLLAGTGLTGHNLCAGGEYPADAYWLLRLALDRQEPEMVIYEIDPSYFMGRKEVGNNYLLFWHEFPAGRSKTAYFADLLRDHDFRTLFFPWYEYSLKTSLPRVKNTLYQKLTRNYDVSYLKGTLQEYHENGYLEKYPIREEDFPAFTPVAFDADGIAPENMEYLEKLIALCREKEIPFIAVSMPLTETAAAADPENTEAAWDYFSDYLAEHGIPYYNFNREFGRSYSHRASHFVDYDGHMNGDSAREFSGILGSILRDTGVLPQADQAPES